MNVIDANVIATAVCAAMAKRAVWTGTASTLLVALSPMAGERAAKSKDLAGESGGAGRTIAPDCKLPVQDPHRESLLAGSAAARTIKPHHDPEFFHTRKSRCREAAG
ncbi:hypothetical protein G5V57_18065 [Nordella sp. HKS 07]|uniref:hypothetical protein n=1 Tax=Nordella sp. HKS 07 TaxID=2712222 RepID=UPI0013E19B62|nr:hypothetical protein [Nordella sp. HKS 07]QIG49454.1 hypothetical protein G5V57_18065 [Nordella sp. HKS 07]